LRKFGSFSKIDIITYYSRPKAMLTFTNLSHHCPHIWILAALEQDMVAATGYAQTYALEPPG
jgi:hypothetical protein